MTLLAVLIVVVQAAAGAIWWALLRRSATVSVLELVGMGLALGTFASMLTGVLLVTTPFATIGWLIPTVIVVPVAAWAALRGMFAGFMVSAPRAQSVAGLVGLLAGLALVIVNWSRIPLTAPTTESFADLYFFEALSRGLAEFGPTQSILMSGGSLRYHWFTYAWAGGLDQSAGTAPFVVLTRVLPVVTVIAVTALVAAWAGRLSRVRWVPTLAVLLVVAGGYAGALYGSILNFDSPSQAMTTLWLLAFAITFLGYVRSDLGWPALVAIAALASACTGGKASHALVAAGGAGLVVLVGALIRAAWWRRALLASVVAAGAMTLTYLLVLSGVAINRNLTEAVAVKASTWQGLDPIAGRLGILLGTAALTLAVLGRLGGVGWLLASRRSRVEPEVLFATGGVLVGLAAMLVLRQGVNELWFVLAASAPAAVLSAVGIGTALRRVRREQSGRLLQRPLLWSAVVALPASLACLALSRNWSSHQAVLNWMAPVAVWILVPVAAIIVVVALGRSTKSLLHILALSMAALAFVSITTRPAAIWTASRPVTTEAGIVQPVGGLTDAVVAPVTTSASATSQDRYAWAAQAAEWITENSPEDTVIATSDPLSALVPALTGRPMYLAGELYQAGLGRSNELDDVNERAKASRAFAAAPSAQTVEPLCAAGVDLVWMEGSPTTPPVGTVVFGNNGVTVLRLAAPACG